MTDVKTQEENEKLAQKMRMQKKMDDIDQIFMTLEKIEGGPLYHLELLSLCIAKITRYVRENTIVTEE